MDKLQKSSNMCIVQEQQQLEFGTVRMLYHETFLIFIQLVLKVH
jgi:hypothetical protein